MSLENSRDLNQGEIPDLTFIVVLQPVTFYLLVTLSDLSVTL